MIQCIVNWKFNHRKKTFAHYRRRRPSKSKGRLKKRDVVGPLQKCDGVQHYHLIVFFFSYQILMTFGQQFIYLLKDSNVGEWFDDKMDIRRVLWLLLANKNEKYSSFFLPSSISSSYKCQKVLQIFVAWKYYWRRERSLVSFKIPVKEQCSISFMISKASCKMDASSCRLRCWWVE